MSHRKSGLARSALVPALFWLLLSFSACSKRSEPAAESSTTKPPDTAHATPDSLPGPGARRIIRKAELSLEVRSPRDAYAKAQRVSERHGGFVASASSTTRHEESLPDSVSLSLRVPVAALTQVLQELRRLGSGAGTEHISSNDVTEEFIDLEARLANQRALEQQFRLILERADRVDDALNVERELAKVRTEIDRMEGRRRFSEREVALSTITLSLHSARPLATTSLRDFEQAFLRAYSDSLRVGAGIVTGSIRLAGITLPIAVLIGLPLSFGLRRLYERARRGPPAPA